MHFTWVNILAMHFVKQNQDSVQSFIFHTFFKIKNNKI